MVPALWQPSGPGPGQSRRSQPLGRGDAGKEKSAGGEALARCLIRVGRADGGVSILA